VALLTNDTVVLPKNKAITYSTQSSTLTRSQD